ncbi:MCE family protein [Candidatus Sumerlaeota bacterium]|nr:MCE family protein [Candidatus Sumerlaeota bacterium]
MSAKANHFKIGIFVLCGAALLIAGLIVMGAGSLFQREVFFETYIKESVQGLEVGSPVKYRGVKIGKVSEITTVRKEYFDRGAMPMTSSGKAAEHYIVIRMSLPVPGAGSAEGVQQYIREEVKKGLRVRLTATGITGGMYLETDYYDPEKYPPLEIAWAPVCGYIPSVPSVYTTLLDSVDGILTMLQSVPADVIADDASLLIRTVNDKVRAVDVKQLGEQTSALLTEIRESNQRLQQFLQKVDEQRMVESAGESMRNVEKTTGQIQQESGAILESLNASAKGLNDAVERLNEILASPTIESSLENVAQSTENIQEASANLPESALRLNNTLRRVESLIAEERYHLGRLLEQFSGAANDLREATSEIKHNPGRLFGGNPPTPVEVTP